MRLGARWGAGSPPHPSAPAALYPAIAAQETLHPAASSWTLTWLEGRPRCALDHILTVSQDARGAVTVEQHPAADAVAGNVDDDDDDDWLS